MSSIRYPMSEQQRKYLTDHASFGTEYAKKKDLGKSKKQAPMLERVFDYLICINKLESGDQNKIKELKINPTLGILTFKDPNDQERKFELRKIKDPRILPKMNKYLGGDTGFVPYCKGNQRGLETLQRPFELNTVKELSNGCFEKWKEDASYKSLKQDQQKIIDERFTIVSKLIESFKKEIKKNIVVIEGNLTLPELKEDAKQKLQQELNHLKSTQDQLKNLDQYALTRILLKFPINGNSYQDLKKIAAEIKKEIQSKFVTSNIIGYKTEVFKSTDRLILGNRYACDVSACLFTDKESYSQYCDDISLVRKKENIVDILIRAALENEKAISMQKPFNATDFQKRILFQKMDPELKKTIIEEMAIDNNKLKMHETKAESAFKNLPPVNPVLDQEEMIQDVVNPVEEDSISEVGDEPSNTDNITKVSQPQNSSSRWKTVAKVLGWAALAGGIGVGSYYLYNTYAQDEDVCPADDLYSHSNENCNRQCVEEVVQNAFGNVQNLVVQGVENAFHRVSDKHNLELEQLGKQFAQRTNELENTIIEGSLPNVLSGYWNSFTTWGSGLLEEAKNDLSNGAAALGEFAFGNKQLIE